MTGPAPRTAAHPVLAPAGDPGHAFLVTTLMTLKKR